MTYRFSTMTKLEQENRRYKHYIVALLLIVASFYVKYFLVIP